MKRIRWAILAVAVLAVTGQARAQYFGNATPPPLIGLPTAIGPNITITVNPGLVPSLVVNNPVGYDADQGSEDQYIQIINNSGVSLLSMGLTGPDIFGFDQDGIQAYDGALPQFGTTYEGPGTSFTIADANDGTLNFTAAGGLPSGDYAIFSLEGPPSVNGFTIPIITPTAPEPSTFVIWGALSLVGGCVAWRKRRKSA